MAVSQGSSSVKQIVAVPFAAGIDTKTDPKQMAPGKLHLRRLRIRHDIRSDRSGENKSTSGP